MKALSLDQINHLNSALIVISAVAAWYLPLEVFLFAYAVLGPLHYFTEISWLHDRKYFSHSKWTSLPFYLLAIALLVTAMVGIRSIQGLVFVGFGFALLLTLSHSWKILAPGFLLLLGIAQFIGQVPPLYLIFTVMLPTLIHVCIFTLIFMLVGSMKASSLSGYIAVAVYLVCAVFVLFAPLTSSYQLQATHLSIVQPFLSMAAGLNSIIERQTNADTLVSAFRFIAFVYTYHYLNWFSKTNILSWHKMPKARAVSIAILWLLSVALYYYDYRTGLYVLYFFSIAHVLLEFPLNIQSMRMLYQESRRRVFALPAQG